MFGEASSPCIVSYIDIIGIKEKLLEEKSDSISIMKNVHQIVYGLSSTGMDNHDHVYSWNDSILLLATIKNDRDNRKNIINEIIQIRQRIAQISPCYIICVKGMTIPGPLRFTGDVYSGQLTDQPRHIYIKASSMAFANCFEIEKKCKKHKKNWYIDERIIKGLNLKSSTLTCQVAMLPSNKKRKIYMYDSDPV